MTQIKFAGRLALIATLALTFAACGGGAPAAAPTSNVPVVPESTLLPAAPVAVATEVPYGAMTDTIPSGASAGDAAVAQYLGKYMADVPPADGSSRKITLDVTPDMSVVMTTEAAGKATVVSRGVWSASGPSVAIVLNDSNGQPINETMTFELKDGALNAVTFDKAIFGEAGFALKKQ